VEITATLWGIMVIRRLALLLIVVAGGLVLWFALRDRVNKDTKGPSQVQVSFQSEEIVFSNWLAGVRAEGLSFLEYFATNFGPNPSPGTLKAAENAKRIHEAGPNLTLFVVNALRHENDSERLFLLYDWLRVVSGIDLYYRQSKPLPELHRGSQRKELPDLRDAFIAEWDWGDYHAPDEQIKLVLEKHRFSAPGEFGRYDLLPAMYYGVFAFPALVSEIAEHNSSYAYATFLWLTKEGTATPFLQGEKPDASKEAKIREIKEWWSRHHHKFNKLHPLYERIDGMVKALPEHGGEKRIP
jgi:hypothetical protein